MGMFDGKKGLILGVANERSIAWGIAKTIMNEGGVCGFSHLPDRPDDERRRNRRRVEKCLEGYSDKVSFLMPLDVQQDDQITAFMAKAKEELGTIDFLLHSIAFADRNDLQGETIDTSRSGFHLAMDISVYSFLATTAAAKDLLADGASVCCMTYLGGERCVPGYNVMGICKAALDATTRYLAYDLGPRNVRVNAVSAGPLKTLAGSAAGVGDMLKLYQEMAPMQRNVTLEEVGQVGAFLLSDRAGAITGDIVHVDAGYHIMGSPGRLLDRLKEVVK